MSLIPWIRPTDAPGRHGDGDRPIVDAAIPYDAVWDCVTCGACVEACPVLIEHVDKIVGLRRNLVLEESRFPRRADRRVHRDGAPRQPVGPARERAARLDARACRSRCRPRPRSPRPGPTRSPTLECLYWVGCAAAFDERNKRVARAVVTCLEAAGVRYAVLGQEETCTGDPARRMGNEYVFQMLARATSQTLDRYRPKTIVTACPHCFNTLGNEYAQFGGRLRGRPSLDIPGPAGRGGTAALAPTGGDTGAAVDDLPRLVLPGALQRGHGRSAARPGRRARACELDEMERQRQGDVLLRRGRRPDVDGGGPRDAHQRRAHAPGARDRRRNGGDGLPVLPRDAPRRPRRCDLRARGAGRGAGHRRGPGSLAAARWWQRADAARAGPGADLLAKRPHPLIREMGWFAWKRSVGS